jgi:predicted GNAT superfamily acetyltransferase
MPITIRPIQNHTEYLACETLQYDVWGNFGAVPHHVLVTVQKNGGLVLGAFDDDLPADPVPLIGFVFGFLGRTSTGMVKHCSHMAAVRPAYRDANIGYRLKLAQREHVLAQGLTLITWTFDPLLSRNARFNLRKLGAVCRTYFRNVYGPEPEQPEGVLPSDRFQVDWWIGSDRVAQRAGGAPSNTTTSDICTGSTLLNPQIGGPSAAITGERLCLQIPADLAALQQQDLPRARAWRYQVRELAETAFSAGYVVTDYARDAEHGMYLLEYAGTGIAPDQPPAFSH